MKYCEYCGAEFDPEEDDMDDTICRHCRVKENTQELQFEQYREGYYERKDKSIRTDN